MGVVAQGQRRASRLIPFRVELSRNREIGRGAFSRSRDGHIACYSHCKCRNPVVHIAYITETHPPEVNGVALTTARAVAHLREAGHRVQLLRPRQPGEAALHSADEWRTHGGPIPMYSDLRYGLARPRRLQRAWSPRGAGADADADADASAFVPDLVHVATPGPLAWAALRAARALRKPTSADFRTNFHAYSRHYGLGWLEPLVLGYLRRLHAMADCNFVPTQALARDLSSLGFERLAVVGRGVDAQRFAPQWRDASLRAAWGATDDAPVLLAVGRLAAEKNVGLVFEAYRRLRLRMPGARLVVVGDGPLRARLQMQHPDVHFAGTQRDADLARHYASADLFLFASLTDTFGNVTLEALASSLGVVAFDTAAAGQHVQDGVSGWLAAPRPDATCDAAFHAALARAVDAPAWRAASTLRRAAREAALRADWPRVLQRFEQRLCATAGAAATRGFPHAALA